MIDTMETVWRCEVTRNPVGTDTVMIGRPCQCQACRMAAEIGRLRALLSDKDYIRCKADYNRGHLSHANYLESKERGILLNDA